MGYWEQNRGMYQNEFSILTHRMQVMCKLEFMSWLRNRGITAENGPNPNCQPTPNDNSWKEIIWATLVNGFQMFSGIYFYLVPETRKGRQFSGIEDYWHGWSESSRLSLCWARPLRSTPWFGSLGSVFGHLQLNNRHPTLMSKSHCRGDSCEKICPNYNLMTQRCSRL